MSSLESLTPREKYDFSGWVIRTARPSIVRSSLGSARAISEWCCESVASRIRSCAGVIHASPPAWRLPTLAARRRSAWWRHSVRRCIFFASLHLPINVPDLVDRLRAALGTAYNIQRELGGGGMSRVFVADDIALERPVVIKVLHPELAAGVNVDRFRREVQLLARLQHPHIVPILSAGEVDGLPYYVMPFVRGESLRARLETGPLAPAEAAGLLADVAKALSAAHADGIVHRDIKPDNILISGGAAVVADFGIAKALSSAQRRGDSGSLTSLGTSLGTPAYMAPEQVAGDPNVDARADLYSLGCVGYEALI